MIMIMMKHKKKICHVFIYNSSYIFFVKQNLNFCQLYNVACVKRGVELFPPLHYYILSPTNEITRVSN